MGACGSTLEVLVNLHLFVVELVGGIDGSHSNWVTAAEELDPLQCCGESLAGLPLVCVDIEDDIHIDTGAHEAGVGSDWLPVLVNHGHFTVEAHGLLLAGRDIPGVLVEPSPVVTVVVGVWSTVGGTVGFIVKPILGLCWHLTELLRVDVLTKVSEFGVWCDDILAVFISVADGGLIRTDECSSEFGITTIDGLSIEEVLEAEADVFKFNFHVFSLGHVSGVRVLLGYVRIKALGSAVVNKEILEHFESADR